MAGYPSGAEFTMGGRAASTQVNTGSFLAVN
jgi:hypothetical protein